MTYATERKKLGREIAVFYELDLDSCANTCGVAPCTATFATGGECYNTYASCLDPSNYSKTVKTIRLTDPASQTPPGFDGFPCVIGKPQIAPTKILPDKGLGYRGALSFMVHDFPHHDRGIDPYVANRTYDTTQGTFFGKLKARNPYYAGRIMRTYTGYMTVPFDINNFQSRTYIIDKIEWRGKGRISITGKDILALADDDTSQVPAPSNGTLSVAMGTSDTSLTLYTGQGAEYVNDPFTGAAISGSVPGWLRIGDEVMQYTGVNGDQLTGLIRGLEGTVGQTHDVDDSVQQCVGFSAVNVVDILDYLLKVGAGIPETYIPYDAGLTTPTGVPDLWDVELNNWLGANTLTYVLTEPTGVNEVIAGLVEQNFCYIWWDEINAKVQLKAIAPTVKNEVPPTLSDAAHILADSALVVEDPKARISQLWVYYDKIDITGKDEPSNYRQWYVQADPNEGVNAFNSKAVKQLYCPWMKKVNSGLIVTLAGRMLSRYNNTPQYIKFQMDAAAADVWTGNVFLLDSVVFQDFTGANVLKKMQIIKATEREPGHLNEFEAVTYAFQLVRYGYITPDTMLDYPNETDANRQAYGFIAPDVGNFADGGTPYLVI